MEQRQPFFKPLENQYTMKREKTQQNIKSTPLFTINQNIRPAQEVRDAELSSERMSTLHNRLYQEAEKIRKWKTQTEIEIQVKDKKIKEATSTIENLRKSILELQIQNENLSIKLQDELENREEVLQKIDATRDMCNLLKDYSLKVEDRLLKCETERTELKYLEREHQRQFEELSKKFAELEIKAQDGHNNMEKKFVMEKEEKERLKDEHQRKIDAAQIKLESLLAECQEKNVCIESVTMELNQNKEMLDSLNETKVTLEDKVREMETISEDTKSKLEVKCQEIEKLNGCRLKAEVFLSETNVQLQNTLSEKEKLVKNFEETEKLYVEKIQGLQENLNRLQDEYAVECEKLLETQSALNQSEQRVEELKCMKDMMILERSDAHNKIHVLEESKARLEETLRERSTEIKELSAEILSAKRDEERLKIKNEQSELQLKKNEEKRSELEEEKRKIKLEVEALQERLDTQQEDLERLKVELGDTQEREKKAADENDNLSTEIEQLMEKLENFSAEMEVLKKANQSLKGNLNACSKEKEDIKTMLEEKTKKLTTTKTKADESKSNLEELRKELKETKAQLKEQQQKTQSTIKEDAAKAKRLQTDLDSKTKEVEAMDKKAKAMKTEATNKNKQIKELEKELMSLKNMIANKELKEGKLEDAQKEVESELMRIKHLNKELEAIIKRQDECKEDMEKQLKCISEEKVKLLKEQEALKRQHEGEIAKMVSLLEEYKCKNDKTVAAKDEEIKEIRKTILKESHDQSTKVIENLEKDLLKAKESLGEVQKQSEKLQKDINKQKSQLEEKDRFLEENQKEMTLMKTAEKEKDAELARLKAKSLELEKMRSAEAEMEKLRGELAHLKMAATMAVPPLQCSTPVKRSQIPTKDGSKKTLEKISMKDGEKTPKINMNNLDQKKIKNTPSRVGEWASQNESGTQPLTPTYRNVKNKSTPSSKTSQAKTVVRLSDPKTPSRSILKPDGETLNKKRKVVFSESGPVFRPDSDISETEMSDASSSSGLMEIDPLSLDRGIHIPKGKPSTPLIFKPYAKGQISKPESTRKSDSNSQPRSLPQPKQMVTDTPDRSNTRKTPNKPASRLLKPSPYLKKRLTLGRKHPKKTEDLAWFDSDAVFGFGPED